MRRKKSNNDYVGSLLRIGAPVAGTAIGTALNPCIGGVIGGVIGSAFSEIYTSSFESKYLERRLSLIEEYLGEDISLFGKLISQLNEHEHYAVKRLIKYHCFEAPPEVTDVTVKIIIEYVLSRNSKTILDEVIHVICCLESQDLHQLKSIKQLVEDRYNGEYEKVFDWSDFCKHNQKDSNSDLVPMRLSSMISAITVKENGEIDPKFGYDMMFDAMTFKHLKDQGIISTYHAIYAGMNTDLDIDQFTITPLGRKIISYLP